MLFGVGRGGPPRTLLRPRPARSQLVVRLKLASRWPLIADAIVVVSEADWYYDSLVRTRLRDPGWTLAGERVKVVRCGWPVRDAGRPDHLSTASLDRTAPGFLSF